MANDLGVYNAIFYAQEALIHLRNALGMAARVHRGFEAERRSVNVGDTISIRRPSTFTAEDPIANDQDVATETVNITLDKNPGVRFALTDLELAYTGQRIIDEHIAPAAYAVANKIDQYLLAEYKNIPWLHDYGSATDHTIITGAKMVAFNNAVPMDDGMLHMAVDGTVQMGLENSTTFHSALVTGPGNNQTLLRGGLGTRFGVEVFANQNVTTSSAHTVGTIISGSDQAGALTANLARGATTMALGSMGATETLKAGDTFSIAGNTQRYAVTADATMVGGAANVTFTPSAAQAYSSGAVVTFYVQATGSIQQLLFHEHAFALAMAPLPSFLSGIDVAVATDPVSGLSIRARRWAVGLTAKTYVALDCLAGIKTLNPNLAVRAWT